MKNSRRDGARAYAFTLLEVLVAIAVFSILIVFLGTIVTSVGTVSNEARQKAQNSGNARAILDLMSRELTAGANRSDLNSGKWITVTTSGTGTVLTCYSRNTGSTIAGANAATAAAYRPLSYIRYGWSQGASNSYLTRGDQAVLWTDSPVSRIPLGYDPTTTPAALPTPPTSSNILDGVVNFQVNFLQQDGTISATYSNTTIAAILSLALVDANTLKVLVQTSKWQQLSTLLTNATGTGTPKMKWETAVSALTSASGYPKQIKTGLHFFERTVDLPKSLL